MGVSSMGHGPCTLKETDLTRALRAPEKAGVSVARAEVSRDGTIVLVLNRGGETLPNSKRNEWDEDVARSSASAHSTKGGMRRLAEAGGTAHELMAFSGHKTLTEVQRYTTDADRKRLADAAMEKLRDQSKNADYTNTAPHFHKQATKVLKVKD